MKKPDGLPEPGLYEDVPFKDYLPWPAASNSGLGILVNKSPAHYKRDRDKEDEGPGTPAKILGKATHAVVLEPGIFGEQYRAASMCGFKTGKDDPCKSQGKFLLKDGRSACGTHVKQVDESEVLEDIIVIKPEDVEIVNGCSNAVWEHPAASELLRSRGPTEVSIVWQDDLTGAWCKGRIDKLSEEHATIVDYKTTLDASKLVFERSIWNFGYHRQGAFYLRGMQALGVAIEHYAIIAQEKSEPYAVAVYRLSVGPLSMGDEYIDAVLPIYAKCVKTDEWPGYPDEAQEIHLPPWAWKRGDDELQELNPERGL